MLGGHVQPDVLTCLGCCIAGKGNFDGRVRLAGQRAAQAQVVAEIDDVGDLRAHTVGPGLAPVGVNLNTFRPGAGLHRARRGCAIHVDPVEQRSTG